jgi:hypothetical protein
MSAVLNIDTDEHMLIGQVSIPFRSRRYLEFRETPPGRAGVGLGNLLRVGQETFDRFEAIGALRRRTGKVFAERMLYTMASPEFRRSGLRRLNEAAEVADAVIGDVQAEFEPDEFRQLVRLLRTLGDMSPTAGAEPSS